MQTQTTQNKRKKLNAEFVKIVEDAPITGMVLGVEGPFMSKTYNTEFFILKFLEAVKKEEVSIVLDGGLRGALKLAKIISGDLPNIKVMAPNKLIEIEYTGTVELDGGFECNSYNIYEIEN